MIGGLLLGTLAGYRGGPLDAVIARWADLLLALPAVLLAIVVAGIVGGGYWITVAVLIVLFSPSDIRLIRGAVMEQKTQPYIESARVLRMPAWRIMYRQILPNVVPVAIANVMLNVAFAIVAMSSLSYLGLGVGPGSPDWGRQLSDGQNDPGGQPGGDHRAWRDDRGDRHRDQHRRRLAVRAADRAGGEPMSGLSKPTRTSDRTRLALSVTDLHVTGPAGPIVGGLSLAVGHGETVAIVGESGSGKSVTARALTGLLPPGLAAGGSVEIGGDTLPLDGGHRAWRGVRGARITLLPQDPFTSLSPRHRCGDQIAMALRGLSRAAREAAVLASLAEVGLPARVARQYPFQLSGGMRQRVAIAAALVTKPDVLVADEATTALDVTTQREVLDLLAGLQRERNMGLILVTHDLGVARGRADRITVLYAGRVAEQGDAARVLAAPAHPYTGRLLDCDPPLDVTLDRLPTIPGSVPRLAQVGAACTFAPRCALATDECRSAAPPLAEIGPGHRVACVHAGQFTPHDPERVVVPPAAPAPAPVRPAQAAGTEARQDGAVMSGPVPAEPLFSGRELSEPVLTVRALRKSFGGHVALDGIDLDIAPGESVAVVGESGSGKTTLARIVVGLETADEGTARAGDVAAAADRVPGPVLRAQPQPQRRQFAARRAAGRRAGASPRCPRCLRWSACPPPTRGGGRGRCRAANGSAWPSPAPSRPVPTCSSATRRCRRSTCRCRRRS